MGSVFDYRDICYQKTDPKHERFIDLDQTQEVHKRFRDMAVATKNRLIQQDLKSERGRVARILFRNEGTGYGAIVVDSFTAVGVFPDVEVGMSIVLHGLWVEHPKYGSQFKAESYEISRDIDREGTIAYLETLPGIGSAIAGRIVDKFGEGLGTFDVFQNQPDLLLQVKGIGQNLLSEIIKKWHEDEAIRGLISWLGQYSISAAYAKRIHEIYGSASIAEVKKNPYLLTIDVKGIGFVKADDIARKLGIKANSVYRAQAGVLHCLREASKNGHCYLPLGELTTKTCDLLVLPDFRPVITEIEEVIDGLDGRKVVVDDDRVHLYNLFTAEDNLAYSIKRMAGFAGGGADDSWLNQYQQAQNIQLSPGQRQAVKTSTNNTISIITGGAGTGKSTVSKSVTQYWIEMGLRVVGCSPTAKAALRLKEATGLPDVSTIHRLLGWDGHRFTHNSENPIEADAFLVDEASMADVKLASNLFSAIPAHAVVAFVGDVDQLPSVGAGNVLRDLIDSGTIPVSRLTEIHRQAAGSKIISCSYQINQGEFPALDLWEVGNPPSDAVWVRCKKEEIPGMIGGLIELYKDQQDNVQLLSPQHKGEVGNIELNRLAQHLWNPGQGQPVYGDIRQGDRIIQTVNNYDLNVFNGEIGWVRKILLAEKVAMVEFPDPAGFKQISYPLDKFGDLSLGYSVSVHKYQGSECPVVIIPITMSHYMMLQRNLLYTAITRAKKQVIFVGEEKAIVCAVKNNEIVRRNTWLKERLQ